MESQWERDIRCMLTEMEYAPQQWAHLKAREDSGWRWEVFDALWTLFVGKWKAWEWEVYTWHQSRGR